MSIVSSTVRGRGDRRSAIGSWGGDESMLGDIQGVGGESEKIHVSIRLRPLNGKETAKQNMSDWECINPTTIIFKSSMPDRSMLPSAYTFDRVFGHDSNTKQVYEEAAKEVALSVVSGVNASIFAYGQTSSGKTYTMSGITEYAMSDIFQYIHQNQEREFVMKFSAIEIYNEVVRDLLNSDPTPLRLLDDPERGTIVDKLVEETIEDWNHLEELFSICQEITNHIDIFKCFVAQRHTGETALNEFSSRSHQILRLTVESCARDNFGAENLSTLTASLNFVDLAGSERASQTLSTGTRLKEGSHINRSLLTLGTVIRKLSKGKYGHIPYRESKLTRILQNCLGGNAKTAIICTMSPARCHAEQSRNTLMFASCAKQVSTSAQVNVVMTDKALVKQLQREISRLESQVKSFGSMSKANDAAALLREKDLIIEKMEKEIKELTWQRDLAQSHIGSLLKSVGEDQLFRVEENSVTETPDALISRNNTKGREYDQFNIPNRKILETQTSLGDNSSIPDNTRFSTSNDWEEDIPQRDHTGESDTICRDVPCVDTRLSITHEATETELDNTIAKRATNEVVVLSTIEETKELCDVASYDIHEILKRRLEELQKTIETLDKSSPSNKGVSWTRSKSKKAVVMTIPSSFWSNIEDEQDDPEDSDEEAYEEGRHSSSTEEELPQGQEKPMIKAILQLEHETEMKSLNSQILESCVMPKEDEIIKEIDVHFDDTTSVLNSIVGGKKTKKIKHHKQPTREIGVISVVEPLRRIPEGRSQRARDLASETHTQIRSSSNQSQANWSQKFERYRKKIIELWAKCNVPLVHRSYFFLLFKGDPSDNVYLEVELRRLYFIKDTTARGNNPTIDTQIITYTSSPKMMNRERIMLAKQLQKKFTRKEREELYLKWNIDIDTKQRGLQLVGKLWTDMRDMRHVKESSILVVKLIGFVEPQYAPRELFGLSFLNPSANNQKSFSWRDNVSSLL
ncbi:Kinesin-like protein KIN-7J [Linum perenne]